MANIPTSGRRKLFRRTIVVFQNSGAGDGEHLAANMGEETLDDFLRSRPCSHDYRRLGRRDRKVALDHTNTLEFLHLLPRDAKQLQRSTATPSHARNRTGVRTHLLGLPRSGTNCRYLGAKSNRERCLSHFAGRIDSRKNSKSISWSWPRRSGGGMKETDSRECRNCHDTGPWLPTAGKDRAKQHQKLRGRRDLHRLPLASPTRNPTEGGTTDATGTGS